MSGGAVGAGVSGVGSLVGGALGASGASSAAKIQARQASAEAKALGQAGEAAQDYMNPYVAAGQNILGSIQSNMPLWGNINNSYTDAASGQLNKLTNGLTENYLTQTPGYQFNLNQGEQAATNSAAARGLANSGAALKGASTYASGLADNTYQNQFNDTLNTSNALLGVNSANQDNINNTWNRENALLGYGASAATNSAQNALTAAGASANYGAQSANALASGKVGTANSLASGVSGAGNSYLLYNALINGKTT
ncbi:hypothetical protein JK207_07540 [Gluconobacter cerinus]|uniref:hypothetical protein n=1 Tax=Gluconobacter cerinus TaxID=38307 RepID=UPI001B8DA7DD|nr:hypothetical protein [Gluconobacter cerinus]MBS1021883.1 hypothetical protein [Gluconobacter cerinus]